MPRQPVRRSRLAAVLRLPGDAELGGLLGDRGPDLHGHTQLPDFLLELGALAHELGDSAGDELVAAHAMLCCLEMFAAIAG